MDSPIEDDAASLAVRMRVPEHVTYRHFPDETVVLNLESGMYHGLNPTAARMLETLDASDSVAVAIDSLIIEFDQPRVVVQRDVLALCRQLSERGLISRPGDEPG